MMDRGATTTKAHGGVGGVGFITGGSGWLSAAAAARLDRAVTAGLITFLWFTWVAVLLLAVGGLADLIWRGLPWSLLAYFGAAGAAAVAVGCRFGRRLPTSPGQ